MIGTEGTVFMIEEFEVWYRKPGRECRARDYALPVVPEARQNSLPARTKKSNFQIRLQRASYLTSPTTILCTESMAG